MPKWFTGIFDIFGGGDRLRDALAERAYLDARAMDSGKPMMNIDGTPMTGDVDINGNPFGVTQHDSFSSNTFDDNFSAGGGGIGNDF